MAPPWEKKNNANLPQKLKCKYCGKIKDTSQNYSKNEQNKVALKMGRNFDFNNSGARCTQCTGSPADERQCKGVCAQYKHLNEFAKSARTAGGSGICKACSLWKTQQEPDVTTETPPSAYLHQEPATSYGPTEYTYDPEAGDWSDDDYQQTDIAGNQNISNSNAQGAAGMTSHIIQPPLASMISNGSNQLRSYASSSITPPASVPSVPGSMGARAAMTPSSMIAATSAASVPPHLRVPGAFSDSVAPHLRGVPTAADAMGRRGVPTFRGLPSMAAHVSAITAGFDQMNVREESTEVSSVSNPYGKTSSTAGTVLQSPVARAPGQTFNAYDNRGNHYVQQRAPSLSENKAASPKPSSQATNYAPPPQVGRNGWAKPVKVNNTPSAKNREVPILQPGPQGQDRYDSDSETDLM